MMLDPDTEDCLGKNVDAMADFETFKNRSLELSRSVLKACRRYRGTAPNISSKNLSRKIQDYFFVRFGHNAIFDYLHSDEDTRQSMDQDVVTHFLKKIGGIKRSLELADIEYNRNIERIKALYEEECLKSSLAVQVERAWAQLLHYESQSNRKTDALLKVRGLLCELEKKNATTKKWELVNQALGILAGIAHANEKSTLLDTGTSILYWGGHGLA